MEQPYLVRGHGPRTAGNKSLVSFRAGYGITGYVGYIPSSEAIPIPDKDGPALRAGPTANRERGQARWSTGTLIEPASVYQSTHGLSGTASLGLTRKAATVGSPTKKPGTGGSGGSGGGIGGTGGSYFVGGGELIVDGRPRNPPFVAKSLYADTFTPPRASATAPAIPGVVRGRKPAFLQGTTYACTYENSTEMMYGVGWLDANKTAPKPHMNTQWREVIVQRIPETTNYQGDFGEFGDGCQGTLPNRHDKISLHGTTRELFKGTPKQHLRMPGYQGSMPTSERNPLYVAQSTNDHDRPDPKDIRLFGLQQYQLEIPGTMIFQPREASNLVHGPQGRYGTDTSFRNAFLDSKENLAEIARKRATQKHHGSQQATKKFFQGGELSVSENGLKNAEAFFKMVRPFGGLPRISIPSAVTEVGGKFSR